MEAFGLEVEEALSSMATQYWAEGVWTGKWSHELEEAWNNQALEVHTWRQVGGPAGAEVRNQRFGHQVPHWHTLVFEGDRRIDMRYVCGKDVKKMLLQQARSVYWKKWAAKHECEELKECIWLEPALALLRKETEEDWTEEHRHVARKLLLTGVWVQKKLFDIGWPGESECQACHKEEGKAQALPKSEQFFKKEWKWQRGIVTHPLGESQWNRGHFSMKKWECEKHKKLEHASRRLQGPRCH